MTLKNNPSSNNHFENTFKLHFTRCSVSTGIWKGGIHIQRGNCWLLSPYKEFLCYTKSVDLEAVTVDFKARMLCWRKF